MKPNTGDRAAGNPIYSKLNIFADVRQALTRVVLCKNEVLLIREHAAEYFSGNQFACRIQDNKFRPVVT